MRETLRQLQSSSSGKSAGRKELRLLRGLWRLEDDFRGAMDDDFDTVRALKSLLVFLEGLRRQMRNGVGFDAGTCDTVAKRVRALVDTLGICLV